MQVASAFVLDALDAVLSWELPDEVCSNAVSAQACLMAGLDTDDVCGDFGVDITVH